MHQKTRRSLTAIAALTLALAVSLSGCAALAGHGTGKSTSSSHHTPKVSAADKGKPTEGECWTATIKTANVPSWTHPPVDCAKPHQLYTFAVPQLEQTHQRGEYATSGNVADSLYSDAWQTCGHHLTDVFPNLAYPSRIELSAHIPSVSQWQKGARWVRCDMAVIAVGSPLASPEFENLPDYGGLRDTGVNDTYAFNYCTNEPITGSPAPSGAVFADCTTNPTWLLYGYQTIPEPSGDTYPTAAQLTAAYENTCKKPHADAGQLTYPIYPSASDWQNGDENLQCWIGRR